MADKNEEVRVKLKLAEVRKFMADGAAASKTIDNLGKSAGGADKNIKNANSRLAFFHQIVRIISPAAAITGIGLLAQAFAAVGGGAIAMIAGVAPAVGVLASLGPLGATAATSMGLLAFAFQGMKAALGGTGGLAGELDPDKMALLTPAARHFAEAIQGIKGDILDLQARVGDEMFPGFENALATAHPLFDFLDRVLPPIAGEIGNIAEAMAEFLTQPSVMGDASTMFGAMPELLALLVPLGTAWAHILTDISIAALPMTRELVAGAVAFSQLLASMTASGRQSGKLAAFFQLTMRVVLRLGSLLWSLGASMINIGKAAFPLGTWILDSLTAVALQWERWTGRPENQRAMMEWFNNLKPTLTALAQLMGAIVVAWVKLGSSSTVAGLIDQIRLDLLPLVTELLAAGSTSLGAAFIGMFSSMLTLMIQLQSPMENFITWFGIWISAITWIVDNVPGVHQLLGVLLAIAAIRRVVAFTLLISGIGGVVKSLRTLIVTHRAAAAAANITSAALLRERAIILLNQIGYYALTVGLWIYTAAATAATAITTALSVVMAIVLSTAFLVIAAVAALAIGFYLAYTKVEWFRNGVNDALAWIVGAMGDFVTFMANLPSTMAAIGANMWHGIVDGFRAAINAIIGLWNGLEFHIGGTDLGPLGHLPSITIGTPDIPLLAMGGIVQGRGSWISGDAGPELNTSMGGSRVRVQPLSGGIDGKQFRTADGKPVLTENEFHLYLDGREITYSLVRHVEDKEARS